MLSEILKGIGHEVVAAVNGTEAWEVLKHPDAPTLAILDRIMPGMDGFEIVRRIRSLNLVRSTYIIMLTVKEKKNEIIAALEPGANDYLSKPFDSCELLARVEVGRRMMEMQEKLRVSESQKNTILNGITTNIALLDKELKILWANKASARSVNKRAEDMIGHPCYSFWGDLANPCVDCPAFTAIQTGKSEHKTVQTPDGRIWDEGAEPVFDTAGNVIAVIEIAQDITERKRAEDALHESEALLRKTQEIAHLGSWELTISKNQLVWSDEVYRIFGLEPQEFAATYEAFLDAVHPDDRANVHVAYSNSLKEGKDNYEIEHRVVCRGSGEIRHVLERCEHIKDASGKVIRSIGMVQDITGRKLMEEIQTFLAQTSSGIVKEPFFNTLARYLAQSLGMDFVCIDHLEGDGLTARTVAVWCDGHFEDNVTYALKDTPCGDVVGNTVCCFPANVCQFFPRDQALRDLRAESYVGVTLWSHVGRPIGLIAVIGRTPLANSQMAEATLKMVAVRAAGELEYLEAEEALAKSEERYAITLAAVNDGFWDWHVPSGKAFFSTLYYAILGYRDGEFPATYNAWRLLVHPEDIERVECDIRKSIETGRGFAIDLRMREKSGDWLWVSTRGKAIELDVDGNTLRMVGTLSDITERKKIENERESLIVQLHEALDEVKQLSGILPICMYCKKIRNDKGYWNQLETYISEHSEAKFSHGLCSDCAKKHYPDLYQESKK